MWRHWLNQGHRYVQCCARYSTDSWKSKTVIHKEVSEALLKNKPVVALESTIITHGMPFPQNLKTARSVIEIIRRNGVVPATIAVLNGKLHIGLTRSELEYVSKMGKSAIKTSRRDLSAVLSKGLVGGTTVSGTMVASAMVGIPIFVTGGIGGVHYGAEGTFDVSADLIELGRSPVAVVCAGVKSILDIGLTLEYLETHGVTVATFGDSLEFPAFFTPNSGFKVPYNVKTPEEAAAMIDCNIQMGLKSGMVIGVPIPESHAVLGTQIEAAIQQALQDAKSKRISGKEVTPFVLQRVNQLTKGKSLEANVALIQNNALVGSRIALELSKLRQIEAYGKPQTIPNISEERAPKTKTQPVVIGGSNVDFTAKANFEIMFHGATNIGTIRQMFGGVARNIAECIARIGHCKPLLISAVGGDDLGEMLLRQLELVRVSTYGVHISKASNTATYSVVLNNNGEVVVGIGDMEAHGEVTAQLVSAFEETICNAPIVIIDGNIEVEVIHYCIDLCKKHSIPVVFEPTCVMKAAKPFATDCWKDITFATPNLNELRTMNRLVRNHDEFTDESESETNDVEDLSKPLDEILRECVELCRPLMDHISTIIVTLGKYGVVVCRDVPFDSPFAEDGKFFGVGKGKLNGLVSAMHFPAYGSEQGQVEVVSVTGAGDSLTAAFISSALAGHPPEVCVKAGLMAAWYSVQAPLAVSTSIIPEQFTIDRIEFWAPWQATILDIEGYV